MREADGKLVVACFCVMSQSVSRAGDETKEYFGGSGGIIIGGSVGIIIGGSGGIIIGDDSCVK